MSGRAKYDIEKIRFSGFIAQEVEQAALKSGYNFSGVQTPVNNNTLYTLRYAEFVVPLVKGMQEQQAIIDQLQADKTADEQQINLQEERIKRLEEQVDLLIQSVKTE